MRIFIILLTLMIFGLQPLGATTSETLRFRTFSPKGGFSNDGVVDIGQDKDGFIWIMLDYDLLRFDGYEYQKYTHQFHNPDTTNLWSFISFVNDASGTLHVITTDAVYKYDNNLDTFIKVMDAELKNLAIDQQNTKWGLKDNTLHKIAKNDSNFIQCLYNNKPISGITHYSFGKKKLFFASHNNIYLSDTDRPEEITLLYSLPPDHSIAQIQEQDGDLWVLTSKHGIFKISTSNRSIEKQLQFQDKTNAALSKTFLIDKNGKIWIGTQLGLYIIDPSTGEYHHYHHSKSDPFSLPNNSVWKLYCDYHGNIWIGHYAGGVCFADLDDSLPVRTYTPSMTTLNYALVSSFAEHGDIAFIGMDGGGVNCLDKRSGIISQFRQAGGDNDQSYNHVKSLAVDSLKRLWVAMYRNGLDCFDLKSKKLRKFRHNPDDSTGLLYNDLRKIVLDRDSGLWIAYQNVKTLISYLSFDDEKCRHYTLSDNAGYIFDMQEDSNGNLYALTRQKLFKLNASSDKSEEITGGVFSGGQSLAIDSYGDIWIGTIGHGLVKYTPSTGSFSYLTDILPTYVSAIYSISPETGTDFLWLGTDNGLLQFDTGKNTVRRFDEYDGFQGQVYYPLAVFRSDSGHLYFGGTNGFSVFYPSGISVNHRKPQARISRFYVDNKPVSPALWKTASKIDLEYDQANFGFKFSSDNYQTPEKNLFKYRLKGYDKDWITTDASNRTVMYSKVPPGNYEFEVLAANNDGVWSDTPTTVKIIRHPAPWASPLAYVIYTILAIIVIWRILHYRNEKRKLKMRLFMDSIDKQKKEELHKSQLSFFTNISHDFRTPISLILAAIDNMKQEGIKDYYYRILHNNSHRLLNLVNELMDFRTLENNKMKLNVQSLDANTLVRNLASDFEDYAKKRNISFSIKCDPDLPTSSYIDKQVLEKIVMNLLNNAFKYTPDGGEIAIETYSSKSKYIPRYRHYHNIPAEHTYDAKFIIAVRDTGCGISEDSIKDVFERYYMVNTTNNLIQHLGTGIGLALVKSLVLLHHGSITIYSENKVGTDILVAIPTDSSAYKEDEYATDSLHVIPEAGNQVLSHTGTLLSLPDSDTVGPDISSELEENLPDNQNRILLVEDHKDLRTLIAGFLKLHYEIIEASDGVEAMDILKNTSVDLIISDIMMPNKDGITLCREVKENIETSHIPIMLLTARTGSENRMEGADAGADLYFSKPIDFNLLLQSVKNIFRHQHNLREHYAKFYFADRSELSSNNQDAAFLNKLTEVIDANLEGDNIDVNFLATELCMSRSKLYSKLKALTGKSIVEFILNYRMRKAAKLIVEQDVPLYRVMEQVGIRSQSYFVNAFKKEFGETPSAFMTKHRNKN